MKTGQRTTHNMVKPQRLGYALLHSEMLLTAVAMKAARILQQLRGGHKQTRG